jgi:DNA-binding GntR family transcriptional regulator
LQATIAYGKRDTKSEHQAIVDAAISRDTPRAIALLNDHIQRTTDLVLTALCAVAQNASPWAHAQETP